MTTSRPISREVNESMPPSGNNVRINDVTDPPTLSIQLSLQLIFRLLENRLAALYIYETEPNGQMIFVNSAKRKRTRKRERERERERERGDLLKR